MDIQTVVRSVKEPLRSYNFVVELPSDFGNAERLKYQVLSVSLPSYIGFDTEVQFYAPGFQMWKMPSKFKVDEEVVIEFWEDEELSVYRYFSKWRDRIVETDEGSILYMCYRFRSQYVRDVFVSILSVKGEVVKRFKIEECFPVSVKTFSFGYKESDIVTVEVTFSYKKIILV